MLKVLVYGVALSSIWFWLFILSSKEFRIGMLKLWLKVIVPQGILIAFALTLMGIL